MIALGLAVLHLVMALAAFNPAPHVGGDNGAYVSLARSLLERGQYLELWDPSMRPHTQYPPVFPGILALAMAVGLKPWVGLKLVVVAFSVGAVALSYLWMRRVTGGRPFASMRTRASSISYTSTPCSRTLRSRQGEPVARQTCLMSCVRSARWIRGASIGIHVANNY